MSFAIRRESNYGSFVVLDFEFRGTRMYHVQFTQYNLGSSGNDALRVATSAVITTHDHGQCLATGLAFLSPNEPGSDEGMKVALRRALRSYSFDDECVRNAWLAFRAALEVKVGEKTFQRFIRPIPLPEMANSTLTSSCGMGLPSHSQIHGQWQQPAMTPGYLGFPSNLFFQAE